MVASFADSTEDGKGTRLDGRVSTRRLVRYYDATANGLPLILQLLVLPLKRGRTSHKGRRRPVLNGDFAFESARFDRFRTRKSRRQAPIRKYRTSLAGATDRQCHGKKRNGRPHWPPLRHHLELDSASYLKTGRRFRLRSFRGAIFQLMPSSARPGNSGTHI